MSNEKNLWRLLKNNLPKDYSFGYVGNIWDKWQSDDRSFYIEDNTGKKISHGYYDINEIDRLWYALQKKLIDTAIENKEFNNAKG